MTKSEAITELVRIWHSPHLDLMLKARLGEVIETLKENNQSDSLVRDDAENCKESESKLDLIRRQDAIEVLTETIAPPSVTLDTLVMRIDALPSAEAVHKPDYSYEAGMVRRLKEALSAEAAIGDYPNDLISRSALMEYCSNQKSKSIDNNDIARFPSAEAVEVVRCKDCIRTKGRDEYTGRLWCSIHRGYMEDTYYCADGLRREDGEA